MPFHSTRYPSLPLGLLQATLARHDIPTQTHYLNLHFAARIGWERYETFSYDHWRHLGEWLFARAAFRESAPLGGAYLEELDDRFALLYREATCDAGSLLELRESIAPAFIADCLDLAPWEEYDVVGFGSTFAQNCATLALAHALKERYPHIITVFGGANLEGSMGLELVRSMPWIDYAVIGEGDEAFPALLKRLRAKEAIVSLPGVAHRDASGRVELAGPAPRVSDLDTLPDPQFDDFFATGAALRLPGRVCREPVSVLYESSRGCWWGAKHHCTFCGLNDLELGYRSKSPGRVLAEIHALMRRYGVANMMAVDNILDQRQIAGVFTRLAEQRVDYDICTEVKANLTQEQLRTLRRGGVRRIQPGIESLSSHVLALMRKGVTGIQNIRLLKWCEYYGITVAWNILTGFPGELPEDYERQLAILRLIPHLQPPGSCDPFRLNRFSPFFEEAEAWGIGDIRPDPLYRQIYPSHVNLSRLAYEFEHTAAGVLPEEAHTELHDHVRWWRAARAASPRPYLGYLRGAGRLTIMDGRRPGAPQVHSFGELAALVYECCGPTHHRTPQILAYVHEHDAPETDLASIRRELEELTGRGLMLEEDGYFLSLALPANPNW